MDELVGVVSGTLSADQRVAVRRARAVFRAATQSNAMTLALSRNLYRDASDYRVVSPATPVEEAASPQSVTVWTLPLSERLETIFLDTLIPSLTQTLTPVTELMAGIPTLLRDAVASYGVEVAGRATTDANTQVVEAAQRAARQLEELEEQVRTAATEAEASLNRGETDTVEALRRLPRLDPRVTATRVGWLLADVSRWWRETTEATRRWADGVARRLGLVAAKFARRREVRDRRIRSGHEQLDAAGVRAYLDAFVQAPTELELPTLTDRRLFVVRRSLVRDLVATLSGAVNGRVAVLISGPPGAGRTSLLNLVQPQLSGRRVVRLDPLVGSRQGPIAGLAAELSVEGREAAVTRALKRRDTVVLLDDLSHWLPLGPNAARMLLQLAKVVVDAGAGVRWLVTVDEEAKALLSEVAPVTEAFTRHVPLKGLTWKELEVVIDRREAVAGYRTDFVERAPFFSRLPLLRGHEKEVYLRELVAATGGHIGPALLCHAQALHKTEDRLEAGRVIRPNLPFPGQLTTRTLAVLTLMARFGAVTTRDLATALREPESEVNRALEWLQAAGLAAPTQGAHRALNIPAHLRPSTRGALMDARALRGSR